MTEFIALPHRTAEWLLRRGAGAVRAVSRDFQSMLSIDSLSKGVVSVGPIRIVGTRSRRLMGFWNTDYLSGTGSESWGLIKVQGKFALFEHPEIVHEVFERCLQIIERRLQGLKLDSSWVMRKELQGITTCIAGRGKAWEGYRLAYAEGESGVLIIGPEWETDQLRRTAQRDGERIAELVYEANSLLLDATQRPTLEHATLEIAEHVVATALHEVDPSVGPVSVPPFEAPSNNRVYETLSWTYDDWMRNEAQLTETQRLVLTTDILDHQPIRLVGAAGSGKTLLMMLLAIRQLRKAEASQRPVRLLYVAHNSAMRDKAKARLAALGAERYLRSPADGRASATCTLEVRTLFDYSLDVLGVPELLLIDGDAEASKRYQRAVVTGVIRSVFMDASGEVQGSLLFRQVSADNELFDVFAGLVADEIAIAIKGQGMMVSSDRRQYIDAERPLSRLHGIMNGSERELVWRIFAQYQNEIGEEHGLLDADDLALSLLGRLRTPLWELRRREEGYDFLFVDEAQLFNENEKRLFHLLTKRREYVPVALALDQAQQTRALATAGIGALGVADISNQILRTVHRCTHRIAQLAFFVIQHATDLFGADFPEFPRPASPGPEDDAPFPTIIKSDLDSVTETTAVIVSRLRANRRQIAVVCFSDKYWNSLRDDLRHEPHFRTLEGRGESLPLPSQPLVVLAKPNSIGGQEFDAVICVGLEQGVVPLRIQGNDSLTVALEQQALREMYLSFTRARRELVFPFGRGSAPTSILQAASDSGWAAEETLRIRSK